MAQHVHKSIMMIAIAKNIKAANTGPLNASIAKYIVDVKISIISTSVNGAATPWNASETPWMVQKCKISSPQR